MESDEENEVLLHQQTNHQQPRHPTRAAGPTGLDASENLSQKNTSQDDLEEELQDNFEQDGDVEDSSKLLKQNQNRYDILKQKSSQTPEAVQGAQSEDQEAFVSTRLDSGKSPLAPSVTNRTESEARIKLMQANLTYLIGLTVAIGLSSMQFGIALSATGPVIAALKYQLNWGTNRAVVDLNSTILSTSAIVGIAIGSVFGADFVKNGRRATLIQFNVIGLIGSLFTLFLQFEVMCFGRFVFGLSSGVLLCATPKYLDEVVPSRLIDKGFGTSTNIIINLAVMIILLMATGLPDDPVDLQATYYWYLIYAFQIPFQLLAIFLHSYVYTEEPIDFCIKNGKTEEALKLISKIYSNETPEMQREFYQAKLEQHQRTIMHQGQQQDTLWHALTDENMRVSSWVSITAALFNNLSGIGIINIYSTAIFDSILRSGAQAKLTIKEDNTYIGYAGVLGALISFWTVQYFSRRTIFVGGHFFMGIFHFLSGYYVDAKQSESTLISVCLFIIVFQTTQGTAFWIYVAEIVTSDAVMGLCLFSMMVCLVTESLTTQFLLNSKIGVNGLFYILGFIQMVAFITLHLIVRETKGLSAQEKKALYSPQTQKSGAQAQQGLLKNTKEN